MKKHSIEAMLIGFGWLGLPVAQQNTSPSQGQLAG